MRARHSSTSLRALERPLLNTAGYLGEQPRPLELELEEPVPEEEANALPAED